MQGATLSIDITAANPTKQDGSLSNGPGFPDKLRREIYK